MFDLCFHAAFQPDRLALVLYDRQSESLVRRFAEFAVVIDDATLHPFEHVGEAIEFFGR